MSDKNRIMWIGGLKGMVCMVVYSGHIMGVFRQWKEFYFT